MTCANCGARVPLDEKGRPVSRYWKGSPDIVIEAYCSAKCGLIVYQRIEAQTSE